MKVIIILFLSLYLTFEPIEGHGFHPWIFMKNTGRSTQAPTVTEISADDQKEDLPGKWTMSETLRKLVALQKSYRPKNGKDCQDLPTWYLFWHLYKCN